MPNHPDEISIEELEQILEQGPPQPPVRQPPEEPETKQIPVPSPEVEVPSVDVPPMGPSGPAPELGTTTPSEVGSLPQTEGGSPFGGDLTAEDLAISQEDLAKVLSQYADETGKVDPVVARYAVRYFELWGVAPPPGYIEKIIKSGMNIYEFEDFERSKPAFRRTETYQNEYAQAAEAVARLLGLR